MEDNFPSFDVPSSVSGASPTPAADTSSPTFETPSTPAPEIAPAHDPLWAPLSAEQAQPDPAPVATPPAPRQQDEPPALSRSEQAALMQTQLLAQIAERLANQGQPQHAPAEAPVARDPKSVAIEQALLKHIPALGPILEAFSDPDKAAALQAVLNEVPQVQHQRQQFYADYADQTATALASQYGEAYGVDLGTLSPAQRTEIENDMSDQFTSWLTRPQNARLLDRYERGDIRVVQEFNQYFRQRFVAPAKRQGQATLAQRGSVVAALPRGGASTIPAPHQSAPRVPSGERDVFGEAWSELAGKRAAG